MEDLDKDNYTLPPGGRAVAELKFASLLSLPGGLADDELVLERMEVWEDDALVVGPDVVPVGGPLVFRFLLPEIDPEVLGVETPGNVRLVPAVDG